MNETNDESSLEEGSGEDVFDDGEAPEGGLNEETEINLHESKEDILRRKKIRRMLERRLEKKRLKEELDDFIDFEEEAEDFLEDDEDELR